MNKYDAPCSVCGQMLPGYPKSLPAGRRTCLRCRLDGQLRIPCVTCGVPFVAFSRAAKYCGESCKPPKRTPDPKQTLDPKPCLTCGEALLISRHSKYCGPPCRPKRIQIANGPTCAEPGCTKPSRKRGRCCTHYNRHYQPNRSHGLVPIAEWVKQNPERAARAREIKSRRRRARMRAAVSEPYTLAEIAARDRYICQLCRKRVAMKKRVPHPKSPTVDHIVPLVESLDDTRANVQLACFGCNSRKGARGGGEQLLLFG